jgi:hypothetical protein
MELLKRAGGQGGNDVRVADRENTISGKLKVESAKWKVGSPSDMDAEISALEGKLSKAREVKAGMMSVLLTGKIRLVES